MVRPRSYQSITKYYILLVICLCAIFLCSCTVSHYNKGTRSLPGKHEYVEVNRGEVLGILPDGVIIEENGKYFVDMDKLFKIVEKSGENVSFSFSDVNGIGHSINYSAEGKINE